MKDITYTTLLFANNAVIVARIGGKDRSLIKKRIETVIAYGVQARRKPPEEHQNNSKICHSLILPMINITVYATRRSIKN
jgi:hypothetical protein